MPHVTESMKADQIGAEHAGDQFVALRMTAEVSNDGNGVCRKKPIFSSGMAACSIAGTSMS